MDNIEKLDSSSPSAINFLLWLTIAVHLIANIFGISVVQYTYLVYVALLSVLVITKDVKEVIFPFIIFSLFEGQGRVVWGYTAWARIIFDILMVLLILKKGILRKKLWDWKALPTILNILFVMHFFWFGIELFNPSGAGFLVSFATSKFYIFPILLFFFFLDLPFDSKDVFFQRNILALMLVIIGLAIVVIVQDSGKEQFMGDMNSNYLNLFAKFKIFQDYAFRPWGTSFAPGGMGTLFFGIVGFILLFNPKVLVRNTVHSLALQVIKYICLALMLYCFFIGEVRSATIKFVGIILFVEFWNFLKSGKKFKKIVTLCTSLILITLLTNMANKSKVFEGLDYENEISRWTELDKEGIASQRSGFWKIADSVQERVSFPLGFGLGMTTNFLPAFESKRRLLFEIPRYYFWNMDNLFMFLLLELGVGAIFYGGALIFIFTSSISLLLYSYKNFSKNDFKDLSVGAGTIFFIFIGNWGAVGIPYNPESFFFWFWVAVLFKTVRRVKESDTKELSEQNNNIE